MQVVDCVSYMERQRLLAMFLEAPRELSSGTITDLNSGEPHAAELT